MNRAVARWGCATNVGMSGFEAANKDIVTIARHCLAARGDFLWRLAQLASVRYFFRFSLDTLLDPAAAPLPYEPSVRPQNALATFPRKQGAVDESEPHFKLLVRALEETYGVSNLSARRLARSTGITLALSSFIRVENGVYINKMPLRAGDFAVVKGEGGALVLVQLCAFAAAPDGSSGGGGGGGAPLAHKGFYFGYIALHRWVLTPGIGRGTERLGVSARWLMFLGVHSRFRTRTTPRSAVFPRAPAASRTYEVKSMGYFIIMFSFGCAAGARSARVRQRARVARPRARARAARTRRSRTRPRHAAALRVVAACAGAAPASLPCGDARCKARALWAPKLTPRRTRNAKRVRLGHQTRAAARLHAAAAYAPRALPRREVRSRVCAAEARARAQRRVTRSKCGVRRIVRRGARGVQAADERHLPHKRGTRCRCSKQSREF